MILGRYINAKVGHWLVQSFSCDSTVTIVRGGHLNFEPITLEADKKVLVQINFGKFGIVKHVEGEQEGKRIFNIRKYRVKKKGAIRIKKQEAENKVFLVEDVNGQEIETEQNPVELTTYYERKRVNFI